MDKTKWQAYCTTCGWVGTPQPSEQKALDDGGDHEVAAADDRNIHEHHYTDVRSGS